ncbi:c-type cytochrome [Spongiimicrobium sp. 3-5]|uniref:c-type cytochrome n=1 Tax=Spongiimicrobium sp. 3-5 TaxID=3332596 RepID=UPI00397F2826
MSSLKKIGIVLLMVFGLASCSHEKSRNYQYMPNMYVPVGYETYGQIGFLPGGMEAQLPVENTIPRGWMPYKFDNSPEGKELARLDVSPLDSLQSEANLAEGKELYNIYCAICHGNKGSGKGNLVEREKILGVPSYGDVARDITAGSTYHTIYYGLNSMGSYAGQLDHEERWKVADYVMQLKQDLTK